MKKTILTAFAALFLFATSAQAQTPATVHASWTPNPATDNVTQYSLTLDAGTPVVILASACSATLCPAAALAVTVPTFGSHTVSLVAQNLKLTTDPTSIQSGPATTITFTLAAAPIVAPQSAKITN